MLPSHSEIFKLISLVIRVVTGKTVIDDAVPTTRDDSVLHKLHGSLSTVMSASIIAAKW